MIYIASYRRVVPAVVLLFAATLGCRAPSGSASNGPPVPNTALARAENDRAFACLNEGKYEEAEELINKSLAADVMYGPAYNNLGLVHFHQGKLYQAAWDFQNAAKLMPDQPQPRNNLGLVFERAGQLDNAAAAYGKAHDMAPDSAEYLGNLARAHVRRGDRDEQTRQLLEEVVYKDPRPDWSAWAREHLFAFTRASQPVTRPSAVEPQQDGSR